MFSFLFWLHYFYKNLVLKVNNFKNDLKWCITITLFSASSNPPCSSWIWYPTVHSGRPHSHPFCHSSAPLSAPQPLSWTSSCPSAWSWWSWAVPRLWGAKPPRSRINFWLPPTPWSSSWRIWKGQAGRKDTWTSKSSGCCSRSICPGCSRVFGCTWRAYTPWQHPWESRGSPGRR